MQVETNREIITVEDTFSPKLNKDGSAEVTKKIQLPNGRTATITRTFTKTEFVKSQDHIQQLMQVTEQRLVALAEIYDLGKNTQQIVIEENKKLIRTKQDGTTEVDSLEKALQKKHEQFAKKHMKRSAQNQQSGATDKEDEKLHSIDSRGDLIRNVFGIVYSDNEQKQQPSKVPPRPDNRNPVQKLLNRGKARQQQPVGQGEYPEAEAQKAGEPLKTSPRNRRSKAYIEEFPEE